MLAVVPVRDGTLPLGALETVAECGGMALLAGSRPDPGQLAGVGTDVCCIELGPFQPACWAEAIALLVAHADVIVLPASPDGRDLAPRLAHRLGRRLLAGAIAVSRTAASVARSGGTMLHDFALDVPFVATLQPGARGFAPEGDAPMRTSTIRTSEPDVATSSLPSAEPEFEGLLGPDVATMDLSEASRIVAGGAGLDDVTRFEQLGRFASEFGAAMGATRVVTDRGWVEHQRQIGTTGIVVDPSLYVAFGISGAVQHTAGLGDPEHIISVNTDPHCPMMQIADLAIVADANRVLDALQPAVATPHDTLGPGSE